MVNDIRNTCFLWQAKIYAVKKDYGILTDAKNMAVSSEFIVVVRLPHYDVSHL